MFYKLENIRQKNRDRKYKRYEKWYFNLYSIIFAEKCNWVNENISETKIN